ncbi:MAG: isocitrate/isopropylmalate dehydrogenase family protein [Granulosicoccus sp.]
MTYDKTFSIAVFEGDGIGPEITTPCCRLLEKVCALANGLHPERPIKLDFSYLPAGARAYLDCGDALPAASVESARQADAILLSAMGDPAIRYPDGTELTPQIDLRFELGLYAGLRPIRTIPGVPGPLSDPRAKDIDFVLVRESIEGLFAPQAPGRMIGDEQAEETLVITRKVSEKLFDATFRLASQRTAKRQAAGENRSTRVTCIDKANVFQAFAFFRKLFHEAADRAHKLDKTGSSSRWTTDHAYVDIMSLNLVTHPWDYDVMVTENMFGDILSDLGAALVGGMGYAPSADIGDDHAVFQPCHGTAPDIAGRGLANPTAMFLSGAMMLEWLGNRHNNINLLVASQLFVEAIDSAFAAGQLRTVELGGPAGLNEVTDSVENALSAIQQRAKE